VTLEELEHQLGVARAQVLSREMIVFQIEREIRELSMAESEASIDNGGERDRLASGEGDVQDQDRRS